MIRLNLLLLCSALFFAGCGEDGKNFTQFKMEFTNNVTIPSNSGLNLPFDVFTPEVETNSESKFRVEDTRKDLIEEILLEKAELTIVSPIGQDFAFLNDLYLYLNADGLDEVLIADIEDIPDNVGSSISLNPKGKDFKEYIKKDEFSIRVKAITDKVTNRDVEIRINTEYQVDAKILGQ